MAKKTWNLALFRMAAGIILILFVVVFSFYWLRSSEEHMAEIDVQTKAKEPSLSFSQYERVSIGMSYAEVASLFGFAGELAEGSEENDAACSLYIWKNGSGAVVQISFMHDAVTSKTQYGLEPVS
ncbi:MAG: hypothetical protein HFE77_04085 [Clostridiales bacterium]|nr:hypothetical protein [Clostridiales bacterium]